MQLDIVNNFECPYPKGKTVLICGAMATFDKGILDFLNDWNELVPDQNMIMLSEVTAQYRRYTAERLRFPYICTPHLLAKEMVIRNMEIPVTSEMEELISEKNYMREAVQNMKGKYPDLGQGYAVAWGYYTYVFISALLNKICPHTVILWNEFYAFHHVFCGICKEKNIELKYMEFGCLPGTFCIEKQGQQGESIPACRYFHFRHMPVLRKEIMKTSKVIDYMRNTGINRNYQIELGVQVQLFRFWKSGRKNISYFGHNRYESGMYPYTSVSEKYHSPVFCTDIEAMQYLQMLCIKNGWNLIYKPHPIMCDLKLDKSEDLYECNVVKDVNINSLIDFTDVTVTIVSQCAYISLIREKPVVMLGYTQLKRKGCTYEAFKKEIIEKKMIQALEKGYTGSQKRNFFKHCAQLLKYYLFDDCTKREIRFGRNIQEYK